MKKYIFSVNLTANNNYYFTFNPKPYVFVIDSPNSKIPLMEFRQKIKEYIDFRERRHPTDLGLTLIIIKENGNFSIKKRLIKLENINKYKRK